MSVSTVEYIAALELLSEARPWGLIQETQDAVIALEQALESLPGRNSAARDRLRHELRSPFLSRPTESVVRRAKVNGEKRELEFLRMIRHADTEPYLQQLFCIEQAAERVLPELASQETAAASDGGGSDYIEEFIGLLRRNTHEGRATTTDEADELRPPEINQEIRQWCQTARRRLTKTGSGEVIGHTKRARGQGRVAGEGWFIDRQVSQ